MVGVSSRWASSCLMGRTLMRLRLCLIPPLVVLALLWAVVSSLSVYPHSLSYFNEFAGGTENGHKHLLHSSVDWGQDLIYLKEWADARRHGQPLFLAYWGPLDPTSVGIEWAPPDQLPGSDFKLWLSQVAPGWHAISVNYLVGDTRRLLRAAAPAHDVQPEAYVPYGQLTPATQVGSLYLYRIGF